MDAVSGVDLQTPPAVPIVDHLVDAGGAEFLARVAELARAAVRADTRIEDLQVSGLVLSVSGRGEEHRSQPVARRQCSIEVLSGGLRRVEVLQARVVRRRVLHRPRGVAAGNDLEGRIGNPEPQTALEARLEVAHRLQFLATGRFAPARVETGGRPGLGQMRRCQHSRANGLVNALYLRQIDTARGITNQQRARHLQLRDRLPAACGNGARTGSEDLAAFQQRSHARVMLELLKRLEWRETRVLVVQSHDEANVDLVRFEVVREAAAVGAIVKRPAESMADQARLDAPCGELP